MKPRELSAIALAVCVVTAATRTTARNGAVEPGKGRQPAVPVPGVSPRAVLRWPSLARWRDTLFVTGNAVQVTPLRGVPVGSLAILRIPGPAVAAPPGDFSFIYPKGAVDSKGSYHLFWAEPSRRDSSTWLYARPLVSLYTATYRKGHWETAAKLLDTPGIHWSDGAGAVAIDSEDRFHLVVPVDGAGGSRELWYGRIDARGVVSRRMNWRTSYASIAAWASDSLAIAFAGVAPAHPATVNALLVIQSGDGGRTWSAPQAIDTDPNHVTIAPQIVANGRELHIVAGQSTHRSSSADQVEHWVRRNGANRWSLQPSVPLAGTQFVRQVAAMTSCGSVMSVVEALTQDGFVIRPIVSEIWWADSTVRERRLFDSARAVAGAAISAHGTNVDVMVSLSTAPSTVVAPVLDHRNACTTRTEHL